MEEHHGSYSRPRLCKCNEVNPGCDLSVTCTLSRPCERSEATSEAKQPAERSNLDGLIPGPDLRMELAEVLLHSVLNDLLRYAGIDVSEFNRRYSWQDPQASCAGKEALHCPRI